MNNVLNLKTRSEFYNWLKENHNTETECYIQLKRGNPKNSLDNIPYIDGVEVALCFGWIDTTLTKINNVTFQKFTPRKNIILWSELNRARMKRLISLGEMTEFGLKVCPSLYEEYVFPTRILNKLKEDNDAYLFFTQTPILYQRIRIYNIDFYYTRDIKQYEISLANLIKNCHNHKMYGEWNDYGRLI